MLSKSWFLGLIAAILAGAAFSPAFNAEFVWDDSVVQLYQVPNQKGIKDAFFPPTGILSSTEYYRPMVVVSYILDEALNNAVHGDPGNNQRLREDPKRARIPHATTILIHMAASFLVGLLAHRCFKGKPWGAAGAWTCATLFALHPVHAETVSFIAGRSDSLATAFLLGAVLCALKWRETQKAWMMASACGLYLLALLSKEVGIAGLVVMPLALWLVSPGGKDAKGLKSLMAGLAVATICFFGLRYLANLSMETSAAMPLGLSLANSFKALAFYLQEIIFPWPLSPYIPYLPGGFHTAVVLSLAMLAITGAWYLGKKRDLSLFAFGGAWFAASLAPSFYLIFNTVSVTHVAERYLYLPSVGFCVLAGAGVSLVERGKLKAPLLTCLALVGAICLATGFQAASRWKTERLLWQSLAAEERTSKFPLPWTNLAFTYLYEGNLDVAQANFNSALAAARASENADTTRSADEKARIYNGLGQVKFERAGLLFKAGNLPQSLNQLLDAEREYQKAVDFYLYDSTFCKNLAQSQLQIFQLKRSLTGETDRATLEKAKSNIAIGLRISPGNQVLLGLQRKSLNP